MTLRTGFSHSLHGAKAGPWLEGHPPSPSRDEGRQGKQGQQQLSGTTSRKGGSPQPFPRHLTPQQPGQHGKWGPCARGRVQMPEGRGECDAYRLTRSARAHPRPEGPQSQERSTHMWSSGGGWPHKCQIFFLQLFSLSLVFFFSISSDANFFFFFACGCRCHHLIFKNKSHLVLFFCRHRHQGRGRGRHKHATGRPCPEGGWAPNTNSVR